jgi:hypothetical protein
MKGGSLASNNVHRKLHRSKRKKSTLGYPKTRKSSSLGLSYIDRVYSGVYDPITQKLTVCQKGGSPVSYIVNKHFLLKHLMLGNKNKSRKKSKCRRRFKIKNKSRKRRCLKGGSDWKSTAYSRKYVLSPGERKRLKLFTNSQVNDFMDNTIHKGVAFFPFEKFKKKKNN